MKKIITLLLSIVLCFFSIENVYSQGFETKVDSIINNVFSDKNGPGAVFFISKKGEIIYRKSFGKSNVELSTELKTDNVFQIGSMTKQFTAVAIMILEERGQLNVLNKVSDYVADYPNGDKITLQHLLTHTSGIKDFTKMKTLKDITNKEMTPVMLVDFFKNEPIDFQPGEKFEYNNSGYVLLGHIIEVVSGEKYEDFIKKNIFDKVGMKNSYYATDKNIIFNRAYGYHKKDNLLVNKTIINYSVPFASGALMSTVDDLFLWQKALNNNVLLNSDTTKKLFTKNKLNNGETVSYGYGWHLKEINEIQTREHGGSIFGYKSMAIYIPSEDVYVVGLSNCDCNSPTQTTKDIASLMIKNSKK